MLEISRIVCFEIPGALVPLSLLADLGGLAIQRTASRVKHEVAKDWISVQKT